MKVDDAKKHGEHPCITYRLAWPSHQGKFEEWYLTHRDAARVAYGLVGSGFSMRPLSRNAESVDNMRHRLSYCAMPKELRTYVVPTVVFCRFEAEMRVDAASPQEAAKMVRQGKGTTVGECYDWDRFHEDKYVVSSVKNITEED